MHRKGQCWLENQSDAWDSAEEIRFFVVLSSRITSPVPNDMRFLHRVIETLPSGRFREYDLAEISKEPWGIDCSP